MEKDRFSPPLSEALPLRFHMALIFILSGVLFAKLLLLLAVTDPVIRYSLTAACSYLLFFLIIKLSALRIFGLAPAVLIFGAPDPFSRNTNNPCLAIRGRMQ